MKDKQNEENFLLNRWRSLGYAFRGFFLLIRTENAIQAHVFFALIFIVLGFVFNISLFEWLIQLLAIGLILSIEGLNTAIEKLCDFIHPDYHKKIGFIKDISAGAVTFAAIFGYLSLIILYLNKLYF